VVNPSPVGRALNARHISGGSQQVFSPPGIRGVNGMKTSWIVSHFLSHRVEKYLAVVSQHPPYMGMPKNEKFEQIYEFSPTRSVYPQFSATYPQVLEISTCKAYFCTSCPPVYMGVAFFEIFSIILAHRVV
jgi:hypothetical protein